MTADGRQPLLLRFDQANTRPGAVFKAYIPPPPSILKNSNVTGTVIPPEHIRSLLEYERFKGIVIVDEAYVDFADDASKTSAVQLVKEYTNLCVMQTLSKSFGLAAIRYVVLSLSYYLTLDLRLGIGPVQPPLIQILTDTKAPYNISTPTTHLALSSDTSVIGPDEEKVGRTQIAEAMVAFRTGITFIEGVGRRHEHRI